MLVVIASATIIVAASLGMVYCIFKDARCERKYSNLLAYLVASDADSPSGSVTP